MYKAKKRASDKARYLRLAAIPGWLEKKAAYSRAYHHRNREKILASWRVPDHLLKKRRPGTGRDQQRKKAAARREYLRHKQVYIIRAGERAKRLQHDPAFLAKKRAALRKYHSSSKGTRNYAIRSGREQKGHHSPQKWLARVEFFGWRCAYCTQPLTDKTLTKDHSIPLSKNGTDWPANLVPACRSCNSRKHARNNYPRALPLRNQAKNFQVDASKAAGYAPAPMSAFGAPAPAHCKT